MIYFCPDVLYKTLSNMNEFIKKSILNALNINLGYKDGDRVGIVYQEINDKFDEKTKEKMRPSIELSKTMYEIYKSEGIDAELLFYVPEEARNGTDATEDLYEKTGYRDILFLTTAFSLTHTRYRKTQTEKGTRIASMPGFTLKMFDKDGPMDVDYNEIHRITCETAEKLSNARFVRVRAEGTDITVEIDSGLVHISSGMLNSKGKFGNLPGAEAYVVPIYEGDSNGYITIPEGWGGSEPLPFSLRFEIKKGRFVKVSADEGRADEYIKKSIYPLLFEKENFNVLAEVAIGTNKNITEKYIKENGWSTLIAEKIWNTAHFANGNSKGMGGTNDVPVHIDWVVPKAVIEYLK
ncbi:MAG: aminopeptidase [Deltaproteobacteria bacterium]|nr:aminopeptidase [Deltaproteobacteria bacterium]